MLILVAAALFAQLTPGTRPTEPNAPASVSVGDFGAVGDGVHDDATAIQAAMNVLKKAGHGKLVFEPFGVYRVGKWVGFLNLSDFEVDGQGATLKPLDVATVRNSEGDTLRFVECRRFCVHDLCFDGNRSKRGSPPNSTTPVTLRLNRCVDFAIRDCRFRDSVCDDIFLWCGRSPQDVEDHCKYGRITGCTLEDPWRNCISVIHACYIRIDHNLIRDSHTSAPSAGIDIEPNNGDAAGITHHIDVEANTILNCAVGAAAFYAKSGTHDVTFSGNRISNCKTGLFAEVAGTIYIGNILDHAPLVAASCDEARIMNNVVTGSYLHADTVGIEKPAGHVVVNNIADQIHTEAAQGRTINQGNTEK